MNQKAIYAVLLSALIAGTNGLLIKYMTSMTAGSIAWFRTVVPVFLLASWMFSKRIPFFRGNYKKMLGASVINTFRIYLFLISYIYTSIGNAVILFYSWPIFVTLLGVLFLKEKVSKYQWFLILLAFVGLTISYAHKSLSFEDKDFVGMLAAVGASVGYAITVVIFKSEAQNYDKNELIFYQNFASVILFFPFLYINFPVAEWSDIGIATIYGFLIGVVVFSLFFYGLKHLKAATTSSLMYLEVVSTILLGHLVLKESLEPNMIWGGALIVLSSFLLTKSVKSDTAS